MTTSLDKSGGRTLDGRYSREHRAAPRIVHAFAAFGRNESDRRKVSPRWHGVDVAKAVRAGEVDLDAGEVREVPIVDLAVGDQRLTRGRLARASRVMAGRPRAEGDGIDPIKVVEREDARNKSAKKYVVVRGHGDHRVASLKLDGYSGTVPVRVVARKSSGEKDRWVSDKIALLVGEGKSQEQAAAIAYSMYEREHGGGGGKRPARKIMSTGVAGAGAEFAPPADGGASPSSAGTGWERVRSHRARARARRDRWRGRRLRKDGDATGDAPSSDTATQSEPVVAVLTEELKRRVNALAAATASLGEASDKRVRKAARVVAKEVRRARRMRSVPGPYLRAIQSAQAAVEREFESRGWPYGAVRVSVGMGKFDPDQPRDESGKWSETGAGGAASGAATEGGATMLTEPGSEWVARLRPEDRVRQQRLEVERATAIEKMDSVRERVLARAKGEGEEASKEPTIEEKKAAAWALLDSETEAKVSQAWKEEAKGWGTLAPSAEDLAEKWANKSPEDKYDEAKAQGVVGLVSVEPAEPEEKYVKPENWDALDSSVQSDAEEKWKNDNRDAYQNAEVESWQENGGAHAEALSSINGDDEKVSDVMRDALVAAGGDPEAVADMTSDELQTLHAAFLREAVTKVPSQYGGGTKDRAPIEGLRELRNAYDSNDGLFRDGFDPSDPKNVADLRTTEERVFSEMKFAPADEMNLAPGEKWPPYEVQRDAPGQQTLAGFPEGRPVQGDWKEFRDSFRDSYLSELNDRVEKDADSVDPPDYLSESADESLNEAWSEKSDSEKYEEADGYGLVEEEKVGPDDPDYEEKTSAGTPVAEPGTYKLLADGEDYKKTGALGRAMVAERTAEILAERRLNFDSPATRAAAERIARDTWDQWKESSTSGGGLALQLVAQRELGANGRLTPEQVRTAERWMNERGSGEEFMRAYVRANWETTQYLAEKSGTEHFDVYRGIMVSGDSIENEPTEDVKGRAHGDPEHVTVAQPPSGHEAYAPDPHADPNGDGVTDASRVGVPGDEVPPPPPIPRLPNLLDHEREAEGRFADAYERDPDGMAREYRERLAKGEVGDAPNIFNTDDAKVLSADYNPLGGKGDLTPAEKEDALAARGIFNAAVHQTANAVAKRAFVQRLDEMKDLPEDQRTVLVTGGGVGSGKGWAIGKVPQAKAIASKVGAVWDAAGEQNSTENAWIMRECEERGIRPVFAFIHADPKSTWDDPKGGVVERANGKGRMVDGRLFAESYAIGARNFDAFQRANEGKADFIVIQNERGKDPVLLDRVPKSALDIDVDDVAEHAYKTVSERPGLKDYVRRGGTIGRRIWGKGKSGSGKSKAAKRDEPMKTDANTKPGKRSKLADELAAAMIGNIKENRDDPAAYDEEKLDRDLRAKPIKMSKADDRPTKTQTVIVSKDKFKDEKSAKKWVEDNDFVAPKVDETDDSFRFRQKDPSEFDPKSFRTITLTDGVKAVVGKLKKAGGDEGDGHWITMEGGRHMFIADGETVGQALGRATGGAVGDKGGATGAKQRATVGVWKDKANKIASKIKGTSAESAKHLFSAGKHMDSAIEHMGAGKYAAADSALKDAENALHSAGTSLSDEDETHGDTINSVVNKVGAMRDDIRASLSGSRNKTMDKADDMKSRLASVKSMMDEHDVSAADVAEESGLTEEHVKAMLAGEHEPTEEMMSAMEDACDALCEGDMDKADGDGADGAMTEAEMDDMGLGMGEMVEAVSVAIREKFGRGYWVEDLYPQADCALVRYIPPMLPGDAMMGPSPDKSKTYCVPYDFDDDERAVLGEPVEVRRKVSWEPVEKMDDGSLLYAGRRVDDGLYEVVAPYGEEDVLASKLAKRDDVVSATARPGRVMLRMAKSDSPFVQVRVANVRVEESREVQGMLRWCGHPEADTLEKAAKMKEGIVYGVVYAPDEVDSQGEWATAEEIRKAAHGWMLKTGGVLKVMHKGKQTADRVVETYVAPTDFRLGEQDIPKGSWVLAIKLCNDTRESVEKGELTGFSMAGMKRIIR